MATPIQQLVEGIRDGFVLLSPEGKSRYANAAGRAMLGEGLKRLQDAPALRDAIAKAGAKKLALPAAVALDVPGGSDPVPCLLLEAPVGNDLALLVQPPVVVQEQPVLANLLDLIKSELEQPVRSLSASLGDDGAGPPSDATVVKVKEVAASLDKLVAFAAIFGAERLDADDRVVMKDLVCEAWAETEAFATQRKVNVSMAGFGADLPPIYGNRDWLKRVVRECIDNAIRHGRARMGSDDASQVEIAARQMGPHLTLTVRNAGAGALPRMGDRVYLPFNRASGGRKEDVHGLSIGIPLVRKLVELHGGRFKVGAVDDDATECVIELPTGAPQRDAARLDLQQAKRYAEDLGKLLARRKRQNAA